MNASPDSAGAHPATPLGILGAASLVGRPLLAAARGRGTRLVACSRAANAGGRTDGPGLVWCRPGTPDPIGGPVPRWIAVCPAWAVAEHLPWLESLGVRALVAISSTSLLTKHRSPDARERAVAERLERAEAEITRWAESRGVRLCLLRPTMIYDGVSDANVAAIARFIRRHGWFPVAGPARGLRQPVHAADVAAACLAAAERLPLPRTIYTLSGRAPLPFCDLVAEVFRAGGREPRIIHVPRPMAAALAPLGRLAGGGISLRGMAARMNEDLAFDHSAAATDLGFAPRAFSAAVLAESLAGVPDPAAATAEEAAA